jgi:hypothetical protein
MVFNGQLKSKYIDEREVLAYIKDKQVVYQATPALSETDPRFDNWLPFIYSFETDRASFSRLTADKDELIIRRPYDLYQFFRQTMLKVGSTEPEQLLAIVTQTINQNVQQALRVRLQWQNGPFSQQTSRVSLQKRGQIKKQSNLE